MTDYAQPTGPEFSETVEIFGSNGMMRIKVTMFVTALLCGLWALPTQAQGTAQPIVTASYWEDFVVGGAIIGYVFESIEDGHVTKIIIDNSDGSLVEGNPLPAWIIREFGTTTLEAWKVGMTLVLAIAMEETWRRWGRYGGKWTRVAYISTYVGLAVFQAVVVRSNVELGVTGKSFLFTF